MRGAEKRAYYTLLRHAQRLAAHAQEAEDLLQEVLLAAIRAGRADFAADHNRRWLIGALRKRAAFDARSAARRRHRETGSSQPQDPPQPDIPAAAFAQSLPPKLRTTALLVITGHTKPEILWLLSISDAALRQRIADIRRRWHRESREPVSDHIGLTGDHAFGALRRALLRPVRATGAALGSHDGDGHLIAIISQNRAQRQHNHTDTHSKE